MAHLGPDTRGGDTLPWSSASVAKRDDDDEDDDDANDLTVPATPPLADAFAVAAAAAAAKAAASDLVTEAPGGSQLSVITASTTLGTPPKTASPKLLAASQTTTIPDSQDSSSSALAAAAQYKSKHTSRLRSCNRNILNPTFSRKRLSNGQVKIRSRSISPIKLRGHARSASAISTTSTGSHIFDVGADFIPQDSSHAHMQVQISADLKTRLSYAMIKVNNGWQSHSLDQVETLASQAASPVSSNSPLHRRQSSSTSPKPAPTSSPQVHFAPNPVAARHGSQSPRVRSGKPCLAPPAPIQPCISSQASSSSSNGRRRNSLHRNPPALVTHSLSDTCAAPRIDSTAMPSSQPLPQPLRRVPESILSPHQNTREQDAIKTLLFMSSPNNSANLRHTFSTSVSPAPPQQASSLGGRGGGASRNVVTHGRRKGLPGQRPSSVPQRRLGGLDKSPATGSPGSPMDLDSPQQQAPSSYQSPDSWSATKRRASGVSGHVRGALSLPSGLGLGNGRARQPLRDEDIERILDGAANDSSDDEEIQLPARVKGVTSALGI